MTRKQRTFIDYVKRTRPKTISDLRPRFPARFLNEGAYRQTFEYAGLVIKFPRAEHSMCIEHALQEAKAVRRLRKDPKLLALKRYAPTILFFDQVRGVTIMPKYKAIRYNQHFAGFANTFECMLEDLIPEMRYEFDNGNRNFGYNEDNEYVVLDAGLIGETE